MIIGLTGTKASGKSVLAKTFGAKGFVYYSLSDIVRKEASRRGITEPSVKVLQDIGDELRAEGPGILAKITLDTAGKQDDIVVDGIRNPGEVEVLRDFGREFYLVAVDAPQQGRYERLLKRGRASDPKNWEGFLEMEKRDFGDGKDMKGQQVGLCMDDADYFFWKDHQNAYDADIEFTKGKKGFFNLIEKFGERRRPNFDEVFMRQAFEWSLRSTCLRRHVGAVIAEGNVLLSQGYNGPARGIKHCGERGGCLRQKLKIPSGQQLEKCYAKHAEINAILNAGRTERSVVGATLFCTNYPCSSCAGDIIQAGIVEVQYLWGYESGGMAKEQLDEAGIKVQRFDGATPKGFVRFWG